VKTDEQLLEDVVAELRLNPLVGAAQIYVSVTDGVVTLAGRVNSIHERSEAERTVRSISGVNGISLEIGIVFRGSTLQNEPEMPCSIESTAHLELLHADQRSNSA
jgi:BON domain